MDKNTAKACDELYKSLSFEQRDYIYRRELENNTRQDAIARINELFALSDNDSQFVADCVAARYANNSDYDCNLSYWANIDNLIYEVMSNLSKE